MNRIDGRTLRRSHHLDVDVVVIGSGPAGAAVARTVATQGASVAIIEAGPWFQPDDYSESAFGAMASYYRGMGATVMLGPSPVPYVQGRMVGGSSPINGAICWRLPRDIYDEWLAEDPALASHIPWHELEEVTDEVEQRLNVHPTDAKIAGAKNNLLARGADALGLENRPIRRNVRDCLGRGLCLQGCPDGRKLSMDVSYLIDAEEHGAIIASSTRVVRIVHGRRRASGVVAVSAAGARLDVRARRAVVLAASAVQSPALLLRSRIRHGPVGDNLQCHPGVSVAGRFPAPVRMWEGATQGHEVTGLRAEGVKVEALGFGLAILAARLQGVGRELIGGIEDMAHWVDWGAAVRATGRGRVRTVGDRIIVTFRPSARDVGLYRRGIQVMGEMMLAAGAEYVTPGVFGWDRTVTDRARMADLSRDGPRTPRSFDAAATHLFGTCRMGSRARNSVVGLDFRHHRVDCLYVADSSVFPTNLGVNPQVPIMAMATLCGRRILA